MAKGKRKDWSKIDPDSYQKRKNRTQFGPRGPDFGPKKPSATAVKRMAGKMRKALRLANRKPKKPVKFKPSKFQRFLMSNPAEAKKYIGKPVRELVQKHDLASDRSKGK